MLVGWLVGAYSGEVVVVGGCIFRVDGYENLDKMTRLFAVKMTRLVGCTCMGGRMAGHISGNRGVVTI